MRTLLLASAPAPARRATSRSPGGPVVSARNGLARSVRGSRPATDETADGSLSARTGCGDAVASAPLYREQRVIAERQEVLEVARIVGVTGGTEARRKADRPTRRTEICRRRDACANLLRPLQCRGSPDPRQDDDELVARVRDRPGRCRETSLDRGGHLLDRAAAAQVSARVDDAFEAIEIDEQDGERSAPGDERVERLVEVAGVVEARQVVALGQRTEASLARAKRFFGRPAVGDVDAGR